MPDHGTQPASTTLGFKKQFPFRSGSLGIEVRPGEQSRLYELIVEDQPFAGPGDILLGDVSISAAAGEDIRFDSPKGAKASFSAAAAASAGVGLYHDSKRVLEDAGFRQHGGLHFSLPKAPDSYYVLFRWGYDIKGSASGSMALGAPSVGFAADASREGRYAVVCRAKNQTGARTALESALDNWIIPSRLDDPDLLAPGTWLLTEVDAALSIKLNGTYGFDFSWVREANLAGLTGDLGLKIQLGIEAQLGYSVSGNYTVIASRETADRVLRIRIFKGAKKGWRFGLDARAAIMPKTGKLLPAKLDDLVLAILGMHPQQLLRDLKELQNWISGTAPLSGALANISVDYMKELLTFVHHKVASPPGSPDVPFDFYKAKSALLQFLDTWGGLDSKLSSLLWTFLDKAQQSNNAPSLASAKKICKALAGGTQESYTALLDDLCGKGDFLSSPAGQWLETLALGNLLAPVTDSDAFRTVQSSAATALKLLDTTSSENAVLIALHEWIDSRIQLPMIRKQLETYFSEDWIRAKLGAFLDKTVLASADVEKIRTLLKLIEDKSSGFYEKAVSALKDTYNFSFSSAYQTATTDQSLLDVEFDFTESGQGVRDALARALSGDFDALFLQPIPGVKLNRGILSHGVTRHSTVRLKLPFYSSTVDHMNKSLAKADCIDADGGQLMVYQVDAEDDVSSISNRGGNDSHMVLAATIPPSRGNNVRVFDSQAGCTYSYRQASKDMKRAQLQYQLKPYIDVYLPGAFNSNEGDFDAWLSELENRTDPPLHCLGYTLVALDLSLPGSALASWWKAPDDEHTPEYMEMSLTLQQQLKNLLPFHYFADVSHFATLDPAFLLLAYSSIPVSTSIREKAGRLQLNTNRSVYWDWMDTSLRRKMLSDAHTQATLLAKLPAIHQRLQASGMSRTAGYYEPGDSTVGKIISSAYAQDELLKGLLYVEARVVQGALEAGIAIAGFRKNRDSDIRSAVRALGVWGGKVAETFNNRVTGVYGADALRPLGTMILAAAAGSLAGSVATPSALLRVIVLKEDSAFSPADFLRGKMPDSDKGVFLQQSILAV